MEPDYVYKQNVSKQSRYKRDRVHGGEANSKFAVDIKTVPAERAEGRILTPCKIRTRLKKINNNKTLLYQSLLLCANH